MSRPRKRALALWAILINVPLIASLIAFACLDKNVGILPIHGDLAASINGYGSPAFIVVLGALMSIINAIMAICIYRIDRPNGQDPAKDASNLAARRALVAAAIIIVFLTSGISVAMVYAQ